MSYTLNSSEFSTWNMTVLGCKGALDIPKRIGDFEYDWGDSHGVEAYTSADDLSWDGREIILHAFYSGSNFINDLETLMAVAGSDLTLITTFGTHNVRFLGTKVYRILKPNTKVLVDISFWESDISHPSPGSAVGGSGVTIGGYDFENDFGLHLKNLTGIGDVPDYAPRNISYGDVARKISGYRTARTIKMELNGAYSDITSLISNVNKLKNVLMSAGSKSLNYRSVSKTVYFIDGANVEADAKTLSVHIDLNLKIQE